MSAALEHGVISQDAVWYCPGHIMYANRKYNCALHTGHGNLTTCESLTHSCNIAFYEIGKRINIDLIADYAKRFGLGSKTGSPFAEKKGVVPSRAWKWKNRHERWYTGKTLSVAIGQSFLLVTPIQIARMIGSIFTRTLVKPRVLVEEPVIKEPLAIKPETLNFIKRSMRDVVIHGTGRKVGHIRGFDIWAKTSTAQISSLVKRNSNEDYMEDSWFTAYFKYKDTEPMVLVILVEKAGSSRVPTQLARNLFFAYRDYKDGIPHTSLCTTNSTEMCEMPALEQTELTTTQSQFLAIYQETALLQTLTTQDTAPLV